MLRKLRTTIGHQDSLYRLHGVIEVKWMMHSLAVSGLASEAAVLRARRRSLWLCEHNDGKPGFVALQAVDTVNHETVKLFTQAHLAVRQTVHTDALKALNSLADSQHHVAKGTQPELASEWLPWVHIVISNF